MMNVLARIREEGDFERVNLRSGERSSPEALGRWACLRRCFWKTRPPRASGRLGDGDAGSFDRRRRRSYNFTSPTTASATPDPLAI